jgi:photosystem II stability/assembly factor-like uncharacterized protein
MKNLILILFVFCFFASSSEAQWIKQFSPDHDLRDIEFINRYTGWTCGENHIYKTTDGGISWNEQSHPNGSLIQQIFPLNDRVVYAAGWWTFLKTTDGGENWLSIFTGGPGQHLPTLEGLFFLNENTGWLVGSVVAMKTTNGGLSFTDSMRIEADLEDVYFKDSQDGIASGDGATFFKTTNGGSNWNQVEIISTGALSNFYRMSVFNDSLVFMGSRTFFKSTDFGLSWDSVTRYPFLEINNYVYNINFIDPMTGYACGASLELFKTINGGYNWIPQQTNQFRPGLNLGLYAYSDSIVWSCGRKRVINTVTGGLANVYDSEVSLLQNFMLYQNYPNPFNPLTQIKYSIPDQCLVTISVYDVLGNKVIELINKKQSGGSYEIDFDASTLPSGIYFYSLLADNNIIQTKKMLLVK